MPPTTGASLPRSEAKYFGPQCPEERNTRPRLPSSTNPPYAVRPVVTSSTQDHCQPAVENETSFKTCLRSHPNCRHVPVPGSHFSAPTQPSLGLVNGASSSSPRTPVSSSKPVARPPRTQVSEHDGE